MLVFEFELNFLPKPKANRYLQTKSGKRFIPNSIKENINDIIKILQDLYKGDMITETVMIEVEFGINHNRKIDLDNIMKTLGDCIEKAGIIKNDTLIVKKILEKVKTKEPYTKVKIYKYIQKSNYSSSCCIKSNGTHG